MAPNSARVGIRSQIIIPARLRSTRLSEKLLLRETGKSLLQHTWESAARATRPCGICIAADSPEIAAEVRRFGGEVHLTDPNAASGTDRVAEVAAKFEHIDLVVNVQGDEPDIEPAAIDRVIQLLEENPTANMATLATPIRTLTQLNDPACVKVVFDAHGRALYFSRSPIPAARDWDDLLLHHDPPMFYQHIGIYAYRREFLLELTKMQRTPLETLENLEQLRVLESGHEVLVGTTQRSTAGIDTPEDYRAFVARRAG